MTVIHSDRAALLALLEQWKRGLINEATLQQSVETILEKCPIVDEVPHGDDQSVVDEVLLQLDALPAVLITRDDIGAIVEFLNTPPGSSEQGWRKWVAYWDSIDEMERRNSLRGSHFYFV